MSKESQEVLKPMCFATYRKDCRACKSCSYAHECMFEATKEDDKCLSPKS